MAGTPKQIKWAEALKPKMIADAQAVLSPVLLSKMLAIDDATWWIANKDRKPTEYRWPAPPKIDENHAEPRQVWQVPVTVNGKPFTLQFGKEGIQVLRKALGQ